MGIIQRQSIKDSIVTYFGVALGAINTLFIYTLIPKAEYGLIEFLMSWTMILSPIILFGVTNLVVRFFPNFRDEERGHNGFLFLMLLIPCAGFLLFCLGIWLFKDDILSYLNTEEVLIRRYAIFLIPLIFLVTFNTVFIHYIKNFLRIVIPTLLENVVVKIVRAVFTLLYFYALISFTGLMFSLVGAYAFVLLSLIIYTYFLGQLHLKPDFSKLDRPLMKDMGVYIFYGVLGGMTGPLMLYIDKAMLPVLIDGIDGLDATGIFAIVAYIGTAIDIPRKSLEKITAPVVANSIKENDWTNIKILYQKSSINQLIAGCLLFLGIWLNLDDFFSIMPNGEDYRPWKMIVFTLALSSIIDMATGINTQIIIFSKYFRFNFYLALVLGLLNVLFNYLYIKTFDLNIYGAALATLTSITIYNVIKFIYIYKKLNMQPFTQKTIWVFLLAFGVYALVSMLPSIGHPLLNIALKSALIAGIYIPVVLYFRFSPDLNNLWQAAYDRAKNWLKL